MAFLDKITAVTKTAASEISNFTKNAANDAGDKIEITKIKMKIADINKEISAQKAQLGELCWRESDTGRNLSSEREEIITKIRTMFGQIDDLNEVINAIKAPDGETQNTKDSIETIACPNCGEKAPANAKFCASCGTPLNPNPTCANCGETLNDDSKFCPGCGTKID